MNRFSTIVKTISLWVSNDRHRIDFAGSLTSERVFDFSFFFLFFLFTVRLLNTIHPYKWESPSKHSRHISTRIAYGNIRRRLDYVKKGYDRSSGTIDLYFPRHAYGVTPRRATGDKYAFSRGRRTFEWPTVRRNVLTHTRSAGTC